MRRYLARVPVRPARRRDPAARLAADPARHHPAHPAEEVGARLSRRSGPRRARRSPRSPRARRRRWQGAFGRGRDRRPCDALRQAGDRRAARRAEGGGLRAHPARAALSAILRGDDGDRERRGLRAIWRGMRWQPALRTLPPYHDDPAYIGALKAERRSGARRARFRARGARRQLPRHAAADARRSAIPIIAIARRPRGCSPRRSAASSTSPSSRASAAPNGWSRRPTRCSPRCPAQGVKQARRSSRPGFSADCLETLEELAIRGRDTFLAAGGTRFRLSALPQRQRAGHGNAARADRPRA